MQVSIINIAGAIIDCEQDCVRIRLCKKELDAFHEGLLGGVCSLYHAGVRVAQDVYCQPRRSRQGELK
jgi:hypothetical protein